MRLVERVFESTLAYRLIQAPFAQEKLAPFVRHTDVRAVRRVLDVGCGPGTNAALFAHCDYRGLDINPGYCAHARRVHGREFVVADATTYRPPEGPVFDCVLSNSLLHHLDDAAARRIVENLCAACAPDGRVHILDLVLPPRRGVARALAKLDRGLHARPVEAWHALFEPLLEPLVVEEYSIARLSVPLWCMLYVQGRPRAAAGAR